LKTQTILSRAELEQKLREFKQQRGAEFDLTALGYFGSYARGEARPDSDVDIVFETKRPNLLRTSAIRRTLASVLNRSVDVVSIHEYLSPNFKARLEREAIYV